MNTAAGREERRIGAKTRWGGLLGQGLGHTLSPLIHNTAADLLGLDCVYITLDMKSAPSRAFFDALTGSNVYGFNVTLPFKEEVAALFPESRRKSCNTLVAGRDGWTATSTDAEGFLRGLNDLGHNISDFEAIICLGHGGAAKALLETFAEKVPGLPRYVLKRGGGRSPEIRPFEPSELRALLERHPRSLLIQSTSAPLKGHDLSEFIPTLPLLKGAFVDLVYGRPSALLHEAQRLGLPQQDGLPMLLHQALLSEQLWWGQAPDFSAMKAALAKHLA